MDHWLDNVANVLTSSSLNLLELAKTGKVDPKFVFQYADLSKCDLRGQDLRGLDFTGAILEGAIIDKRTKIAAQFDPRFLEKSRYSFRVNRRLLRLLNSEADHLGYTYAIWYVKWLFDLVNYHRDNKEFLSLMNDIRELSIEEFYVCDDGSQFSTRQVQIPNFAWRNLEKQFGNILNNERVSFVLLCMLIYLERNNRLHRGAAFALEALIERQERAGRSGRYISTF